MPNSVQRTGPSLKVVSDAEAADKLRLLIKDADDGLRRVVKCGLYIEWMAAHLPHGQLMAWLEAHCPDVAFRTVYRWRSLAKNICEWAGFKFAHWANLPCSGDEFLTIPVKELPPAIRAAREKMEELLDSAKTPKQLFFDMGFKQGQLDGHGYPKAKRGRTPGCEYKGKPAELPALTVEAMIATRQRAALRSCDKIDTELNRLGIDFIALDEPHRLALRDSLHKTLACLDAFAKQPKGKQSVAAIQELWNTL